MADTIPDRAKGLMKRHWRIIGSYDEETGENKRDAYRSAAVINAIRTYYGEPPMQFKKLGGEYVNNDTLSDLGYGSVSFEASDADFVTLSPDTDETVEERHEKRHPNARASDEGKPAASVTRNPQKWAANPNRHDFTGLDDAGKGTPTDGSNFPKRERSSVRDLPKKARQQLRDPSTGRWTGRWGARRQARDSQGRFKSGWLGGWTDGSSTEKSASSDEGDDLFGTEEI
jgi:hypothetical protein